MPNFTCHQCGQQFNTNQRRKGACRYCYSSKESHCRECAWWELGPLPAAAGLPQNLRPNPPPPGGILCCCTPPPPPPTDPHGVNLLQEMRTVCGLIDCQLTIDGFDADNHLAGAHNYQRDDGYGYATPAGKVAIVGADQAEANRDGGFQFEGGGGLVPFHQLARQAIDKYDELYHRTENGAADIAYNKMMRSLAVIYVSAEERCGYINDIYAHHFDAPRVAAQHLTVCFNNAVAGPGAPVFVPGPDQPVAEIVLGQNVIEQILRDKISLANARFVVADLAAGNNARARQIIEMSLILQHVWMAIRPLDNWPANTNFNPYRARGFLTQRVRDSILNDSRSKYKDAAQKKLGALYAAFQNGAYVPLGRGAPPDSRVRFLDAAVAALVPGTLTQRQAYYLQSLPKMDHTGVGLAQATPCEIAVRRRVIGRLKKIARSANVNPPYNQVGHHFQNFNGQQNNAYFEALLDDILDDMKCGRYWIESSMKADTLDQYYAHAGAPANFGIISQTVLSSRQINWRHVFPDCANAPNATALGIRHLPHMLAYEIDGRQNAKRWYLDWRNDKDQYMYDCFPFTLAERPVFANYSVWPLAPEPNSNYGTCQIVWDSQALLTRCVIGVGDKGVAYRSKLLLLQDLLCKVPMATGDDYVSEVSKAELLRSILLHLDTNFPVQPGTQLVLQGLMGNLIGRHALFDVAAPVGVAPPPPPVDSNQRLIAQNKKTHPSPVIFECHVFGPLLAHAHAWALTLDRGAAAPAPAAALGPPPAWIGTIQGFLAGYHVTLYNSLPVIIPRAAIPELVANLNSITQVNRATP